MRHAAATVLASSALALLLSAPPAAGADPADEASRSYRIETTGTPTALRVGEKGTLVLAIVPAEKIHVHPQAPLKITLEAKGLALSKTALGHKDAVDPGAEGPRFEVPFQATTAGAQEARARLDFFVCSDRWCVKQVKDVVFPVAVK
jgi:hypothetical protein